VARVVRGVTRERAWAPKALTIDAFGARVMLTHPRT
jgi:hypothetical protein